MNKVMKNDRIENLKIFENLKDNENYSKLSIKLNKLFKNNSIENFYKNLYEDKKYIISNPLGLSNDQNMNDNFFYNFYKNNNKKNNFNIKRFKQYLKNLQIKEDNKNNKKNNIVYSLSDNCLLKKNNNINNTKDNENNDDNNLIKPKNKKIRFISESPGIGRYNLNYSLVFKRVKNVFFGFPSKKPKFKKIILKKNNNNNDKNFNFSNYKKNISLDSENINNENTNLKTINHCLKFENYTNRKPLVNVMYNNNNNNLNIKNIKKDIKKNIKIKKNLKYNIISFDKMSKRNYSFILKNDVPPIGKYSPNYNLIYSHKPLILIDKNKNNKNNKKYQAHKILYKINVPTEYEIITKLNKKNN